MTDDDRMLGLFRKLADELKVGDAGDDAAEQIVAAQKDPERRVGPYLILNEVGAGGAGRVCRAWHPELKRFCAIKFLTSDGEEQRLRLQREAQMAASLAHPCIVTVHEVGTHRGAPYLVMEFVDGPTLAQVRLTPRETLEIMRAIAEAVQYAHEREIVHRDLKPANILVSRDGRPRITDFGLARTLQAGTTITAPGTLVGTPAYLAPEVAAGGTPTRLSDVYGLGATLYHLLAGVPPYDGQSVMDVLQRVAAGDAPPLSSRAPSINRDVATIVHKAMARDPASRYASARALALDIGRYLDGHAIMARPESGVRKLGRMLARNRTAAILGMLLTFSLIAGAVAVGRSSRAETEARLKQSRDERIATLLDAAGAALKSAEEAQYVADAQLARVVGLADRAIAGLQEALALDPQHAATHALLGRAFAISFRPDDAVRHFSAALRADPSLFSARYGRGVIRLQRYLDGKAYPRAGADLASMKQQALEDLRQAARAGVAGWEDKYARAGAALAEERLEEVVSMAASIPPGDPTGADLLLLSARALAQLGRSADSVEACDRVLRLRPGHYRAHLLRGEAHYSLRKWDPAAADYARALAYYPFFASAWNMLGITKYFAGSYDLAREALDRSTELDAELVEPYSNRATLFAAQGDLDAALRELTKGIEKSGQLELYRNRCAIQQRRKQLDEALKDAEEMVLRYPNAPLAYSTRATVHHLMRRTEAFRADLKRALEIDPDFVDALILQALHLTEEGRFEEAIAAATRALPRDMSGRAVGARGTARWKLGDRTGAIEDFREAARLDPAMRKIYGVFLDEK